MSEMPATRKTQEKMKRKVLNRMMYEIIFFHFIQIRNTCVFYLLLRSKQRY